MNRVNSIWSLFGFSRHACCIALALLGCLSLDAQEVEARRWGHLPVDINFAGGGYGYTTGTIGLDPVLQAQNVEMELHSLLFKYTHTFKFSEYVARFDLIQAYQDAFWSGTVAGMPRSRGQTGWSDTVLRFSMNLIGSPPLSQAEFAEYRKTAPKKNTIVGTGLAVHLPTGAYQSDKLLNLGSNRFTIRPQIGVVHTCGPWSFEATGSLWIYTDNDEFWNGNQLEQDPLLAVQSHVVYSFRPGLWISGGLAYADGSISTINGIGSNDIRRNLGWGLNVGLPIDRQTGIKVGYIGIRALEDIGADMDNFIFAVSRMW